MNRRKLIKATAAAAAVTTMPVAAVSKIETPAIAKNSIIANPPASGNLHIDERRAIDWAHLQELLDFGKERRGRFVQLESGTYAISRTLKFLATTDHRSDFTLEGRGRGATRIVQGAKTIPLLERGTKHGNMRTFNLGKMTLNGGSSLIVSNKCVYNWVYDCELSHGRGTALLREANSITLYNNNWFVHTNGAIISQTNGKVSFGGMSYFGEHCGGIFTSGETVLKGVQSHSLQALNGTKEGKDRAFFNIADGGSIHVDDCQLALVGNQFDAFIRFKNVRDIKVNNSDIHISNTPVVLQNNSTLPYGAPYGPTLLQWNGGTLTGTAPELEFYRMARPDRDPAHKHARPSTTVRIGANSKFDWGAMESADLDNSVSGSQVF